VYIIRETHPGSGLDFMLLVGSSNVDRADFRTKLLLLNFPGRFARSHESSFCYIDLKAIHMFAPAATHAQLILQSDHFFDPDCIPICTLADGHAETLSHLKSSIAASSMP